MNLSSGLSLLLSPGTSSTGVGSSGLSGAGSSVSRFSSGSSYCVGAGAAQFAFELVRTSPLLAPSLTVARVFGVYSKQFAPSVVMYT